MTAERRGLLAIAGAAFLWSTGGLGIKAVAAAPLVVAAYRSAVASVVLGLVLRPALRATPAFLIAIACYAGCLITFVVATKWTTAANAIFLQYSSVVWVLLLAPLVLGERWRARDAAAIGFALVGLGLFFVGRFETRGRAGDVVALLSGVFQAGILLTLRREHGAGAEAAVTWGNVLAAAVLLPVVVRAPAIDTSSAAILVLLGAVQIGAAYLLFVRGIAHVRATQAALVAMLEPVMNPLWVFLLLGERPSAPALAGGAIVLGAIGWRSLGTAETPAAALAPPD